VPARYLRGSERHQRALGSKRMPSGPRTTRFWIGGDCCVRVRPVGSLKRSDCQALACMDDLGIDWAKTNIDGGAIAIGHPLGATGARITGKAAAIMKREGKGLALATQCIGGGQGVATVLEAAE